MKHLSALACAGLNENPGICLTLPAVKKLEAELAATRKRLESTGKKA